MASSALSAVHAGTFGSTMHRAPSKDATRSWPASAPRWATWINAQHKLHHEASVWGSMSENTAHTGPAVAHAQGLAACAAHLRRLVAPASSSACAAQRQARPSLGCPCTWLSTQIYGLFLVKLAVAMTLIGGCARRDATGTHIRGECHMLLIGDPGTGKSQVGDWLPVSACLAATMVCEHTLPWRGWPHRQACADASVLCCWLCRCAVLLAAPGDEVCGACGSPGCGHNGAGHNRCGTSACSRNV